jgi:hypothetical protein
MLLATGPRANASPAATENYLASSELTQLGAQLAGAALEGRLQAGDAQDFDYFGYSLAISGDVVAVGAPLEDGGPGDPIESAGAVYLFGRNQGGLNHWGQITKLTASDAERPAVFGISVAISGDVVVVGATSEHGGLDDQVIAAGAAYIFERNHGGADNWGQVIKLSASDAQNLGRFGTSVAISGGVIIVGAIWNGFGSGDPRDSVGAAYVFERNQGGFDHWGEVKKLTASDPQPLAHFGHSVAISGDIVVVGAYGEDGAPGAPAEFAGATYVFQRNHGGTDNWGQVARLTASDAEPDDSFGGSVAVSGAVAVVGATGEDGGPGDPLPFAGAAYVFERSQSGNGAWEEVKKLTASDAQAIDFFGTSVAVTGDMVLVGADAEDGGPGDPLDSSGASYLFARDHGGDGNWGETSVFRAVEAEALDYLGGQVAVVGSGLMLAGARAADAPGPPVATNSGAVYAFCQDDAFEDNDSANTATPLTLVSQTVSGLQICSGDDDVFRVEVPNGAIIRVEVDFAHADGDLDVALLNYSLTPVAVSESVTDHEAILYAVPAAGTYYIVVHSPDNALNRYRLTLRRDVMYFPLLRL